MKIPLVIILIFFAVACTQSPIDGGSSQARPPETYSFDCDETKMLNKTVIGYNPYNETIEQDTYVCNESQECGYKLQNITLIRQEPILDGSIYYVCEKQNRRSITIAKGNFKEERINLNNKMSSVKGNILTLKDLSDGGSWSDARPDECWHPQIPCEQTEIRLNNKVTR